MVYASTCYISDKVGRMTDAQLNKIVDYMWNEENVVWQNEYHTSEELSKHFKSVIEEYRQTKNPKIFFDSTFIYTLERLYIDDPDIHQKKWEDMAAKYVEDK